MVPLHAYCISPRTDFFFKTAWKSTPLIKKSTFCDMFRHKKIWTHMHNINLLLYFYLFTHYLSFQFLFWIWPPLAGGYLHHSILTAETANPNNKTSPCSQMSCLRVWLFYLLRIILVLFINPARSNFLTIFWNECFFFLNDIISRKIPITRVTMLVIYIFMHYKLSMCKLLF